jgi:hypothetical protein
MNMVRCAHPAEIYFGDTTLKSINHEAVVHGDAFTGFFADND